MGGRTLIYLRLAAAMDEISKYQAESVHLCTSTSVDPTPPQKISFVMMNAYPCKQYGL